MCLGFIDVVFRVLVEVCLKIFSSSREIGILGERDDTWHTKDVSLRSCILLVFRQLFFLAALVVVYLLGHRHLFLVSLALYLSRCLRDFEVCACLSLNFQSVVMLYDFTADWSNFYIVMEVLQGGELMDRITKKGGEKKGRTEKDQEKGEEE